MGVKRVLFVCIENSCRSQMAEAFARIHGGPDVEAFSAGSQPSGVVNAKAIASMRDVGYDLSTHKSRGLDEVPSGPYDAVVTMGCGDACPALPGKRSEDWAIEDPSGKPIEPVRRIRDSLRSKVEELASRLEARR